jgi:hypothetical protein
MVDKPTRRECLEDLGTVYCPNCAIINEKTKQLEIWEANVAKREEELDLQVKFIHDSKLR